ncbi:SURF1 family protein [Planctobacterium marinum]|uniref:SURF1-like protein n=1 Tax=Planctobacterium marinum TaxID=1631968 RepID=A0AA48HRL1_9ALTE|nr:SURF1-like protein [Planctobacterium marinum]
MKKPPLVPTIISFVAVVILLKLGFWQLGRAQEKQLLAEQKGIQEQVVFNSVQSALAAGGEHDFKRAKLTGQVDLERLLYWDNRVLDGTVGYEVLAPVTTNAGILLVNFGWLPDRDFRRSLPEVSLPEVIQQTHIVLYVPLHNQLVRQSGEPEQWPYLLQQPDLTMLNEILQTTLIPVLGYIEDPKAFGLRNNFKPVTMPAEKHIAYAIQWFLLALACALIYGFALRKKWKDERTEKTE